jgi:hypothetical protein
MDSELTSASIADLSVIGMIALRNLCIRLNTRFIFGICQTAKGLQPIILKNQNFKTFITITEKYENTHFNNHYLYSLLPLIPMGQEHDCKRTKAGNYNKL